MSFSAVIVMIGSIISLWGVASIALVLTIKKENMKSFLMKEQGGYEPFSPSAQRDIEEWLKRNKDDGEIKELLGYQNEILENNKLRYYR